MPNAKFVERATTKTSVSLKMRIEFAYSDIYPHLRRRRSLGASYEERSFAARPRSLNAKAKQGGTWVLGPESYASTPGMGLSLGAA
jgi:hypothetical protein